MILAARVLLQPGSLVTPPPHSSDKREFSLIKGTQLNVHILHSAHPYVAAGRGMRRLFARRTEDTDDFKRGQFMVPNLLSIPERIHSRAGVASGHGYHSIDYCGGCDIPSPPSLRLATRSGLKYWPCMQTSCTTSLLWRHKDWCIDTLE